MTKIILLALALIGSTWGAVTDEFISQAEAKHGELGKRAATFLFTHMPAKDKQGLENAFLLTHLDFALKAREEFPWAASLPEEVYFNDVLPYASLDETREDWRSFFYPKCKALVKEAKTSTQAAQLINQKIFDEINVHYNTGRKKPNQSPSESIVLSKASCTGLSIILVDACRSVGIPARIVGTALWVNKRGNHTWVEIYDDGKWYFTGANEYDPKGLNRGWFTADASKAKADQWQHAIWASSWKKTEHHFPMIWNSADRSVPAINVTARYTQKKSNQAGQVFFRVWNKRDGKRLVATLNDQIKTRAGTADLNDMPSLAVKPGDHIQITYQGITKSAVIPAGKIVDLYWNELK